MIDVSLMINNEHFRLTHPLPGCTTIECGLMPLSSTMVVGCEPFPKHTEIFRIE